jgi:hypothetical protein
MRAPIWYSTSTSNVCAEVVVLRGPPAVPRTSAQRATCRYGCRFTPTYDSDDSPIDAVHRPCLPVLIERTPLNGRTPRRAARYRQVPTGGAPDLSGCRPVAGFPDRHASGHRMRIGASGQRRRRRSPLGWKTCSEGDRLKRLTVLVRTGRRPQHFSGTQLQRLHARLVGRGRGGSGHSRR